MKLSNKIKEKKIYTACILILTGIIFWQFFPHTNKNIEEPFKGIRISSPSSEDIVIGNESALYKVIIYTDYECRYCREVDAAIPSWISEFGSTTVAFHLRHLPLTAIHPRALGFAKDVECTKRLYGNERAFMFGMFVYDNRTLSPEDIRLKFSQKEKTFVPQDVQLCAQDPETLKFIEKNAYEALVNELRGTPSLAMFDTEKNVFIFKSQRGSAAPYYRYFKAFFDFEKRNNKSPVQQ